MANKRGDSSAPRERASFQDKLAIGFYSSVTDVWMHAAPVYLTLLDDYEVVEAIKKKEGRLSSAGRKQLYDAIPDRVLRGPVGRRLYHRVSLQKHLELAAGTLKVDSSDPEELPDLSELINCLNRDDPLDKGARAALQRIIDRLPAASTAVLLSSVDRDWPRIALNLPDTLYAFAGLEQYLDHAVRRLSCSVAAEEFYVELIDRLQAEECIPLDYNAKLQQVLDALDEEQAVRCGAVVYERSPGLTLTFPEKAYFSPAAEPLIERLSAAECRRLYDWGVAARLPDDQLAKVLLTGESKKAGHPREIRSDRVFNPETAFFSVAPQDGQLTILKRTYAQFLQRRRPHFPRTAFETGHLVNSLTDKDWRVASIWAENQSDRGPSYDGTRAIMLSARMAEKAARRFYRELGEYVTDVSIQQLQPNNDGAWKTYDLALAGGRKLDVKNARFPYSSRESYVEHRIPKFKKERTGDDVHIVGVVSPYLELADFEGVPPFKAVPTTVLGETSWLRIRELEAQYADAAGLMHREIARKRQTAINSTKDCRVYPPWLFDYPDVIYRSWREELGVIHALPDSEIPHLDDIERLGKKAPFALLLAAGRALPTQWRVGLETWQSDLLTRIITTGAHRSLPQLFLTILSDFMLNVKGAAASFSPSFYKRALFFETGAHAQKIPAGLCDPLATVSGLCTNLETVWGELQRRKLQRFTAFQFQGLGVLRGLDGRSGRWQTLIAYCGGERQRGVACGYPNLVLGKKDVRLCPSCGYLVCPKCSWCKRDCPENKNVARLPW